MMAELDSGKRSCAAAQERFPLSSSAIIHHVLKSILCKIYIYMQVV
jgi:hypothetical protein